MGEMRNAYKIFVGNKGKGPLGRPKRNWETNIKMGLKTNGVEGYG
jgi:hypothetical protein